MKLHWSVKRGGIIVKTYNSWRALAHRIINLKKSKTKVKHGELLRWFVLYLYQYTEWEFTMSRLCCLEAHIVVLQWVDIGILSDEILQNQGLQCYTTSTGAWMLKKLCWLKKHPVQNSVCQLYKFINRLDFIMPLEKPARCWPGCCCCHWCSVAAVACS